MDTIQCKCQSCNNTKELNDNNFYSYGLKINDIDKILNKKYIKFICKECLPKELISWNNHTQSLNIDTVRLRQKIYKTKIDEQIIQKGYKINELISKSQVIKKYNINKNVIKSYVNYGIIKQTLIISIPRDFKDLQRGWVGNDIRKFFLKSEVDQMLWYRENGYFIQRAKPSMKKEISSIFTANPPYFNKTLSGKELLFINQKEQKKPCVVCLEVKSFEHYPKGSGSKENKQNMCRKCRLFFASQEYQRLLPQERKEKIRIIQEWQRKNRQAIREYRKNPINKIHHNIRQRLRNYIKKIATQPETYYLTNRRYELGCDMRMFKEYLEKQFQDGMNWQNYGPGYQTDEKGRPMYDENHNIIKIKQWNIDHIIPVTAFDFINDEHASLKVNHYTNLRPMWSEDNFKKNNYIDIHILKQDFKDLYEANKLTVDNHVKKMNYEEMC